MTKQLFFFLGDQREKPLGEDWDRKREDVGKSEKKARGRVEREIKY